eukprot:CAMPEP_0113472232 /NCGR_PEP_ID=MMETSP0014_2-20120614/17404_1 /TAXON_ID=2857 /ORGANISM="Nitzschia sp." /LENGTH=1587 /DNA_ID=CAMNT_0000364925 /DNA_START=295 /DNA_END=5058 /DNA_ORIENTATION=+ /assembly_acc=CAM_ASM_000159
MGNETSRPPLVADDDSEEDEYDMYTVPTLVSSGSDSPTRDGRPDDDSAVDSTTVTDSDCPVIEEELELDPDLEVSAALKLIKSKIIRDVCEEGKGLWKPSTKLGAWGTPAFAIGQWFRDPNVPLSTKMKVVSSYSDYKVWLNHRIMGPLIWKYYTPIAFHDWWHKVFKKNWKARGKTAEPLRQQQAQQARTDLVVNNGRPLPDKSEGALSLQGDDSALNRLMQTATAAAGGGDTKVNQTFNITVNDSRQLSHGDINNTAHHTNTNTNPEVQEDVNRKLGMISELITDGQQERRADTGRIIQGQEGIVQGQQAQLKDTGRIMQSTQKILESTVKKKPGTRSGRVDVNTTPSFDNLTNDVFDSPSAPSTNEESNRNQPTTSAFAAKPTSVLKSAGRSTVTAPSRPRIGPQTLFPESSAPGNISHLVGIQNLGQSCYANAAVQLLAGLEPIVKATFTSSSSLHHSEVFNEFYQALKYLHDSHSVEPYDLSKLFGAKGVDFSPLRQSDASEFLGLLLGLVVENDNNQDIRRIKDLFFFDVEKTIECTGCGDESIVIEPMDMLRLEVPTEAGRRYLLSNLLNHHLEPEEVERNCECCRHGTARMTSRLKRVPEVILVSLKRFGVSSDIDKITSYVQLDGRINVGSLCSAPTDLIYETKSIITHQGPNVTGGHYKTFATQGSDIIEYNDETVNVHHLSNCTDRRTFFDDFNKNGYVVALTRVNLPPNGHSNDSRASYSNGTAELDAARSPMPVPKTPARQSTNDVAGLAAAMTSTSISENQNSANSPAHDRSKTFDRNVRNDGVSLAHDRSNAFDCKVPKGGCAQPGFFDETVDGTLNQLKPLKPYIVDMSKAVQDAKHEDCPQTKQLRKKLTEHENELKCREDNKRRQEHGMLPVRSSLAGMTESQLNKVIVTTKKHLDLAIQDTKSQALEKAVFEFIVENKNIKSRGGEVRSDFAEAIDCLTVDPTYDPNNPNSRIETVLSMGSFDRILRFLVSWTLHPSVRNLEGVKQSAWNTTTWTDLVLQHADHNFSILSVNGESIVIVEHSDDNAVPEMLEIGQELVGFDKSYQIEVTRKTHTNSTSKEELYLRYVFKSSNKSSASHGLHALLVHLSDISGTKGATLSIEIDCGGGDFHFYSTEDAVKARIKSLRIVDTKLNGVQQELLLELSKELRLAECELEDDGERLCELFLSGKSTVTVDHLFLEGCPIGNKSLSCLVGDGYENLKPHSTVTIDQEAIIEMVGNYDLGPLVEKAVESRLANMENTREKVILKFGSDARAYRDFCDHFAQECCDLPPKDMEKLAVTIYQKMKVGNYEDSTGWCFEMKELPISAEDFQVDLGQLDRTVMNALLISRKTTTASNPAPPVAAPALSAMKPPAVIVPSPTMKSPPVIVPTAPSASAAPVVVPTATSGPSAVTVTVPTAPSALATVTASSASAGTVTVPSSAMSNTTTKSSDAATSPETVSLSTKFSPKATKNVSPTSAVKPTKDQLKDYAKAFVHQSHSGSAEGITEVHRDDMNTVYHIQGEEWWLYCLDGKCFAAKAKQQPDDWCKFCVQASGGCKRYKHDRFAFSDLFKEKAAAWLKSRNSGLGSL